MSLSNEEKRLSVAFNYNWNMINISKGVMDVLGNCSCFHFLMKKDANRMLIEGCTEKDKDTFDVSWDAVNSRYLVISAGFIRYIYDRCNWNKSVGYRVGGYVQDRWIAFNLDEAVVVADQSKE